LGVAFFAMMNIMILSVAVWAGATDATRDIFHLVSAAIALPAVLFAGQPFFRAALRALRAGRLAMDVPISLAIILATGLSLYETFNGGEYAYFDAAVMLTFFLLGGRYLDHRSRAAARSAAQELSALEVPRAVRITRGTEESIDARDLAAGDHIRVLPGGRLPADGTITGGTSDLDRSLLTGESLPVSATIGMQVCTGEVNLSGPLIIKVSAAGPDTALAKMAALVAVAEEARGRYTSLADKAARAYAPLVHILAICAFFGWLWVSGGDGRLAINIAVTVLIITCPCALGLAVPAVVTAASGKLFRKGLLIKSGTALERLAQVDTVVFDKTGTLTIGLPGPKGLDAYSAEDLAITAGLVAGSAHPLARGMATALTVDPAQIDDLKEVPGQGIQGRWQGKTVRFGRAGWAGDAPERDETSAWLSVEGRAPVSFEFVDQLRPGAKELVAEIMAKGLKVQLLSGDLPGPVARIAGELGITDWQAQISPSGKVSQIEALTAAGANVLMVGDGLNDTGALARASVSISPATALDAARAASDIVLLGTDISPVADAITTAQKAVRRIKENFAISILYNIIAVPVALLGFATPLIAALAMSASSITVTLNALRLR
ncbi:MAG: cadmium-translocating P-type ATPase, partial [Rhodobacteraceae bacterium]|nr:cadmium-translocating P-type ATPase [Paracoccaceae bacterium]